MKCVSCGSSEIRGKVCTYCGAAVEVSSISALRALPSDAINAFRTDLSSSRLNDLSHDELLKVLLTQVVVLLERKQWADALSFSDSSRNKFPNVTAFAQYYLVASIAGNFLRKQSLDQVRDSVHLLINSTAIDTDKANLNGYLIDCVNVSWCVPNKLKFFNSPGWEVDEEVIAISQFFSSDGLSQSNLIFEDDGSPKKNLDPKLIAKTDRITGIISASDEKIRSLLAAERLESLKDLKEKIKSDITPKHQPYMCAVLDIAEDRDPKYLNEFVYKTIGDDSFYESLRLALRQGFGPTFGGGVAKSVWREIHGVLESEQKQLKSVTKFL